MSLKHIVSTRLDPDMMRELRLAARGAPVGEALRELVNFALVNRHQFGQRVKTGDSDMCRYFFCLFDRNSVVHWSDDEVRAAQDAAEELGVPWESYRVPLLERPHA